MSDLTFIEEGNDSTVSNPSFTAKKSGKEGRIIREKLINIEKREMVYAVFRRIKLLQERPYPFLEVPQIGILCMSLVDESVTDDSLSELSLLREPRG